MTDDTLRAVLREAETARRTIVDAPAGEAWRGDALLALGRIYNLCTRAITPRTRPAPAPRAAPTPRRLADGLYQAQLPFAVAGFTVRDGRVRDPAPILNWAKGREADWFADWVLRRDGDVVYVGAEGPS